MNIIIYSTTTITNISRDDRRNNSATRTDHRINLDSWVALFIGVERLLAFLGWSSADMTLS